MECHASTIEEDRKDSANTHFEEWWFKTLLREVTAIVALIMNVNSQSGQWAGFLNDNIPCLLGRGIFLFKRKYTYRHLYE